MLRVRTGSFLLFLLSMFVAPSAQAWWNDDWAFRKELTFDLSPAGAAIGEEVLDAPVLVRLSLANFPYFADAKPDGSDLRVIGPDDKTPLKFHIEKFDAQTQIALVWIRVPRLAAGSTDTKVYLYYGNPEATGGAGAADSWDSNQVLAYHFESAATAPQDSTGFKSEPQANDIARVPTAIIGSGLSFDGSKQLLVPASPPLQLKGAQGYTISAWVRIEAAQQATVAVLQEGARELAIGIAGERVFARWRGAGSEVLASQADGSIVGGWHHVAVRFGGGKLALFVDGNQVAEQAATAQDIAGSLTVGTGLTGELDELQVSNTARSAGWLRAAATSQGMVAPLVAYGADAQKDSGGHDSYFASTLRNVTVDGWVIIAVLAVMFVASTLIMIGKVLFLNRIASGNRKFLDKFHGAGRDPASLLRKSGLPASEADTAFAEDASHAVSHALQDPTYGRSMLWVLYRQGMAETMQRVDVSAEGQGTQQKSPISAQSIEAIRATLDASLTRLNQRLQSQMVWLTISISGGPFLGLLGTVVGVMITFAAIAASGDVNINAIAPGTAAALVATVAGLGVAIPCLFGYNYLNTQIKQLTADMRVFVDEFVTRVAERYS